MSHHLEPTSRRRRGLAAAAVLATAGALVGLSVPTTASAAAAPTTIDLYDVNDFHGRLEAAPSNPPAAGDPAGAAVLSGTVEELMAANPHGSAFVSAGDNVGASTFTSFVQDDAPTIAALNEAGLTVSAIGNHELDKGQDDLRGRIADAAEFDYVSSNIVDASGTPAFDPWAIRTIGGVRVGFIGATTELIPELVSPAGIEGLRMTDVVDTVNRYATELTDGQDGNGEADVLVLLLHEGAADATIGSATGANDFGHIAKDVTPDVSVIFSGHTHQLYDHEITPTGSDSPRPVVQTGSYGGWLGHATLTVDPDTKQVLTADAENIPLWQDADGDGENDRTSDPVVEQIVADAKVIADEKGKVVLGTIDADMKRAVQSNGSENRGGESTLGNFVAEVQKTATDRQGAQIAFMNPGGLRADMTHPASGDGEQDGEVSYREAAAVQPFANTLVVEDLTGDQIRQALEQQWQPAGSGRPFLKLGVSAGFSYTYDHDAPAGSRIGTMTLDGAAIDLAATYKVTVNSFLASGGDNFTAFDEAAAKADSGQVDLQAQVEYFDTTPDVTVADDQRAIGVQTTPTPADGFRAGDPFEVRLSSLVFSNAPDQGGEVVLSAGGTELARSTIDTTVVDTTDEQGRATLTFPVPAAPTQRAAVGDALVIALPNGQSITLPVAVPTAVADPAAEVPDPDGDGTPDPGNDVGAGGGSSSGANGVGLDGGSGAGTGATGRDGALAFTGASVVGPAVGAGLLLLAGIGVLLVRRGRRDRRTATALTD